MSVVLTEQDIGQWVTYHGWVGETERGKIKRFDNQRRVAWVVYHANENWDDDHWKDYTAAATHYGDLSGGPFGERKEEVSDGTAKRTGNNSIQSGPAEDD